MVISKRDRSRCELHIGDIKNPQIQIINYLVRIIIDGGKCKHRNQKTRINNERYLLGNKPSIVSFEK